LELDFTPPGLAGQGAVRVTPPRVRAGQVVEVEVVASEPVGPGVVLRAVLGDTSREFAAAARSDRVLRFYQSLESPPGLHLLLLEGLTDAAGNQAEAIEVGSVELDTQAPRPVDVVIGNGERPLMLQEVLNASQHLHVSFNVTETPVSGPVVTAGNTLMSRTPDCPKHYCFRVPVSGLHSTGYPPLQVIVQVSDGVGNTSAQSVGQFQADDGLPLLVNAQVIPSTWAGAGSQVLVSILVNEPMGADPVLTWEPPLPAGILLQATRTGQSCTFSGTVSSPPREQHRLSRVCLRDVAGNHQCASPESELTLHLDGVPPVPSGAEVRPATPGPSASVHAGDTIRVSFVVGEPLAESSVTVGDVLAELNHSGQNALEFTLQGNTLDAREPVQLPVRVRLVDLAGNTSTTTVAELWADTRPPGISLVQVFPDTARTNERVYVTLVTTESVLRPPVLTWRANPQELPGFVSPCEALEDKRYVCTGDIAWTAEGEYTLVDGTLLEDQGGNVTAWAWGDESPGFHLDSQPPVLTNLTATFKTQESPSVLATFKLSGASGDPTVLLEGLTMEGSCENGSCAYSYGLTGVSVADGPAIVSVAARDASGNSVQASVAVTVDRTAPRVSIPSVTPDWAKPGSQVRILIAADEPVANSSFLVTTTLPGVVPRDELVTPMLAVFVLDLPATITADDARYHVDVEVVDGAGNQGFSHHEDLIKVDGKAPVLANLTANRWVVSAVSGFTHFTVEADSDECGGDMTVSLGTQVMQCASTPPCRRTCTFDNVTPGGPLEEGPHTVVAQAIDRAGNVAVRSQTLTADYTGPNVVMDTVSHVLGPPAGSPLSSATCATEGSLLDVTYGVDEALATTSPPVVVVLNAELPRTTQNGLLQRHTGRLVPFSLAGPQQAQVQVHLMDAMGNSSVISLGITLTGADVPDVPTFQATPTSPNRQGYAEFAFWLPADSTAACALDSATPAPCTSPRVFNAPGDGTHAFHVRAVNCAGVMGPAVTHQWVVDRTPPVITVTQQPPPVTGDPNASIAFHVVDASTVTCSLDYHLPHACGPDYAATLIDMLLGEHVFAVTATDTAGNTTGTSIHWKVVAALSMLAAGSNHTCGSDSSRVWCWGANEAGQLGVSLEPPGRNASSPTQVEGLPTELDVVVSSLSVGLGHSCIVTRDRTLYDVRCWGDDSLGQVARMPSPGTVRTPTTVLQGTLGGVGIDVPDGWTGIAESVCAGRAHSCALSSGGQVGCWGDNSLFQLGNDGTNPGWSVVAGTSKVSQIACGGDHTCALTIEHSVVCWGSNDRGQLGVPGLDPSFTPRLAVTGGATFVSAGGDHTCAIVNGGVWCWGGNDRGQLGIGSLDDTPVAASVGMVADRLSLGEAHTCSWVGGFNQVSCWGANTAGQLGADSHDAIVPALWDEPVANVTALALGGSHGCLVQGGLTRCWGSGHLGQLGDGRHAFQTDPFTVSAQAFIPVVAVAGADTTLWLRDDSILRYLGEPYFGVPEPGVGRASGALRPMTIWPGHATPGLREMALGTDHGCYIDDNGVGCWGRGGRGQLGVGAAGDSHLPLAVTLPVQIPAHVVAGEQFTCVSSDVGDVWCWGRNDRAQLGTDTGLDELSPSVPLAGIVAERVVAGRSHVCILSGSCVSCWGDNEKGQVTGEPGVPPFMAAVGSPVVESVVSVASGASHTCAVTNEARIVCWGSNSRGQLGRAGNEADPRLIDDNGPWLEVFAGGDSTCAVAQDVTLRCWGDNRWYQLGSNSDGLFSETPVQVSVDHGGMIDAVTVGPRHVCAGCGENLFCWGDTEFGKAGTNAYTNRPVTAMVY
jgi:alpha-tubulin suppressor-like RCC1 family protein